MYAAVGRRESGPFTFREPLERTHRVKTPEVCAVGCGGEPGERPQARGVQCLMGPCTPFFPGSRPRQVWSLQLESAHFKQLTHAFEANLTAFRVNHYTSMLRRSHPEVRCLQRSNSRKHTTTRWQRVARGGPGQGQALRAARRGGRHGRVHGLGPGRAPGAPGGALRIQSIECSNRFSNRVFKSGGALWLRRKFSLTICVGLFI